jgi:hypothetical protein
MLYYISSNIGCIRELWFAKYLKWSSCSQTDIFIIITIIIIIIIA